MKLVFRAHGQSWQGRNREDNEDSYLVSSNVVAVADGVGGQVCGEVASATVVENLAGTTRSLHGEPFDPDRIDSVIAAVDTAMAQRVGADETLTGMATTLTALFRSDTAETVILAHIGDSRAYLQRGDTLHQVSRDDSLVQEMIDHQAITVEESERHPLRAVVLKILNGEDHGSAVSISTHRMQDGDRWLIATDGLSDYVSYEAIEEVMSSAADPEACAASLIALAQRCDSGDNTTVVVCDIGPFPKDGEVLVGGSATQSSVPFPANPPRSARLATRFDHGCRAAGHEGNP